MSLERSFLVAILLAFCLGLPAFGASPAGDEPPAPRASLASMSKPLALDQRFSRDAQTGVITDFQTGFQWREGPNRPISWSSANTWVKTLGAGWRLPSRAELKTLFVKSLPGPKGGACRNMPREFSFPKDVWFIWAGRRDLNSAWQVSFENGGDCWEQGNLSFAHGCRALAIATGE